MLHIEAVVDDGALFVIGSLSVLAIAFNAVLETFSRIALPGPSRGKRNEKKVCNIRTSLSGIEFTLKLGYYI